MILAIIFFLLGSICHTLGQVDAAARARKTSRIALIQDTAIPIFIRTVISLAIFALWPEGQLVAALNAINVPIPDWVRAVLDLHASAPIAFLVGISLDAALGFIPRLKSIIPANPLANGDGTAAAVAKPDAPKVP